MGQADIIHLLQKSKEPLSAKEIGDKIGVRQSTVSALCRKLLKHNEIKFSLEKEKFGIKEVMKFFIAV